MRAVIYCRVSTVEQASNLSLPTQEKACREYCAREGYDVARVFVDRGESAKTADRPAFQKALEFCRTDRRVSAFVVYSLSRFARSTHDHALIGARLKAQGIALRSVTEPIDDTSTGRLMESILSGFAQFDNDVRAERTKAGMRAAAERGRWTHPPPIGYLKGMVHDPDRAPLVRQAFELAATGTFPREEIRAKMTAAGLRTRHGYKIGNEAFARTLRNPIYMGVLRTGDIEAKGDFPALVDETTFYRAQAALDGRASKAIGPRRQQHPDFPLRGFVRCAACDRPLTASWSKGKSGGRYGYYRCPGCRGVNVSMASLEGAFLELLQGVALRPEQGKVVREAVMASWRQGAADATLARERADRRLRALREKKTRLVDAMLAQDVDRATYRARMAELEEEIALATAEDFDSTIEESNLQAELDFMETILEEPARAWGLMPLAGKTQFQRMVFGPLLTWSPTSRFGTPPTSSIFEYLRAIPSAGEDLVAHMPPSWNTIGPIVEAIAGLRRAA